MALARAHRRLTFREFVETSNDAAAFLQSAKHELNDIALSVLGANTAPVTAA